jgi:N-formylglutamate amidohydrolase
MNRNGEIADVFTGIASRTVLADLYRRPFDVRRPEQPTVPFVFAMPHGGRAYPDAFTAASRLALSELRLSEDAYTDILFGAAAERAPTIAARFPRAYIDVNREPDELDPALFETPLGRPVKRTAHVEAGFGVIARIVREGKPIYDQKLALAEVEERFDRLYRPYHAALAGLIEETRARFGFAVLVDCHSMPGAPAEADIALGDRFGASAPAAVIRRAFASFVGEGFSVTRNTPYAGGYTTGLYARGEEGIHAFQIELSRALYLDEKIVAPAAGFAEVRERLGRAIDRLLAADFSAVCLPGFSPRRAAE